jgi:hypothetical protein
MKFILKLAILELVYITVKEFRRARLILWDGPPMVIKTYEVKIRARQLNDKWTIEQGETVSYCSEEVLAMIELDRLQPLLGAPNDRHDGTKTSAHAC